MSAPRSGGSEQGREATDWSYLNARLANLEKKSTTADTDKLISALENINAQLAARDGSLTKTSDITTDLAIIRSVRNQAQAAIFPQPRKAARLISRMDSAARAALITAVGAIIAAATAAAGYLGAAVFSPDNSIIYPQSPYPQSPYPPYNNPTYPGPVYGPPPGVFPPDLTGVEWPAVCTMQTQWVIDLLRMNPNMTLDFAGPIEDRCHLNELVRQQKGIGSDSSGTPASPSPSATPPG